MNAEKERDRIVILGGGPIGMVCALLCARRGIACELLDARPLEALQRDRRLLALSRGSLQVLESLLGPSFAATVPRATLDRVHVSSRGDLGTVSLGAADFDGVPVGATVWYADLVAALGRAIAATAEATARDPAGADVDTAVAPIRVRRPRRALRIVQAPDRIRVLLDDDSVLDAPLAIDAEGTPASATPPAFSALLASVQVRGIAPGEAIERFTREGPLALLPVPDGAAVPMLSVRRDDPAFGVDAQAAASPGSGVSGVSGGSGDYGSSARAMSLIWCLPSAIARERAQVAPGQFLALLTQALGPRIGLPVSCGATTIVGLATHRRARVCEHRLVHLGNAAQTLHPVAGQGFNLGMRDCVALVDCLAEVAKQTPTDERGAAMSAPTPLRAGSSLWKHGDPLLALDKYQRRRRLDRRIVPGLTAVLPLVFGSRLPPLAAARSAGLLALDAMPAVRRGFTRLLMFGA